MGSLVINSDEGVNRLILDLEELFLENSETADVLFYIGLKEAPMRCHSFLLKKRCKNYGADLKCMPIRYPDLNPEHFHAFLLYLYTGKLSIEESSIFELLCIGAEFEMEDLENICQEILCSKLEPNTVSTIFSSALNSKRNEKKKRRGIDSLINRCILYIGENAGACLQNHSFLALPTESVIEIISSDQLSLEEDEVWKYVLRWSQFQSGVDTHVSAWTKEERQKVAKFLSPVISHVRLLLIDSKLFAEEIEPTGCVPMALSLERYRYAALPQQFKTEINPRLNPRNSPRLFQSSSILKNERSGFGKTLSEWYGVGKGKEGWKLIYRGSTHGYSAGDFYTHCHGRSPTYILIQIQNSKWICGGFTDVPWVKSKSPRYAMSSKSFLFREDGVTGKLTKFNNVKKHFAVCHDSNSGPIFGAGADLYISSNCNTNSDSYSNLPHSYEIEGENLSDYDEPQLLTPTYNFIVSDYEVFVPIDSSQNEFNET